MFRLLIEYNQVINQTKGQVGYLGDGSKLDKYDAKLTNSRSCSPFHKLVDHAFQPFHLNGLLPKFALAIYRPSIETAGYSLPETILKSYFSARRL